VTLAIGVAASVSTLTILHVMSGDPVPAKSKRLVVPLLDVGPKANYSPDRRDPYMIQITYPDAINYLRSGPGVRRTALYGVATSI